MIAPSSAVRMQPSRSERTETALKTLNRHFPDYRQIDPDNTQFYRHWNRLVSAAVKKASSATDPSKATSELLRSHPREVERFMEELDGFVHYLKERCIAARAVRQEAKDIAATPGRRRSGSRRSNSGNGFTRTPGITSAAT